MNMHLNIEWMKFTCLMFEFYYKHKFHLTDSTIKKITYAFKYIYNYN